MRATSGSLNDPPKRFAWRFTWRVLPAHRPSGYVPSRMTEPSQGKNAYIWRAGEVDDLLAELGRLAFSGRIWAFRENPAGAENLGHVDVVAGGVATSLSGPLEGEPALNRLRNASPLTLSLEPRLPHADSGDIDPPGATRGDLGGRPLVALMRYAEDYVLSADLHVLSGDQHATMRYIRGELTETKLDGEEAADRLPEVLDWTEGQYEICVAKLDVPDDTGASAPVPVPLAPRMTQPLVSVTKPLLRGPWWGSPSTSTMKPSQSGGPK